jgi:hypothetical protein
MKASPPKRSRFPFLLLLPGCCVILTLSSCSKKTSETIIGKWRTQDSEEIVEFRKDGTFTDTSKAGSIDKGTYAFTDDNHIKVELDAGNGDTNAPTVVNCMIRVHGDEMDSEAMVPGNPKAVRSHLKRIK